MSSFVSARGAALLLGMLALAHAQNPLTPPSHCQDDEGWADWGEPMCLFMRNNPGNCYGWNTEIEPFCSRCCNTCYDECCLQNGLCVCAAGQYLQDGSCTSCPPNSNSVQGSVGASSCTCNAGYEGPLGGPCNVKKYPVEGCPAGYWMPPNTCQVDSFLVPPYNGACATYYQSYQPQWANNFGNCQWDDACTLCCNACSPHFHCDGRRPQPCTACPANSHSAANSTAASACTCNAGYSGSAGGPCTLSINAASPSPPEAFTPDAYPPDAYTPLACVACGAGFYLEQASLNCTACPEGSGTFEYTNASSLLHCVCLPGFENQTILGLDGEKCEQCRLGFYKEQLRNASCVRCPYNSWTLAEGSANVSACVCDPGFSKPHLGTLPPGEEDHAQPCEECAPGSFKRTQADEACLTCPEDHFCPAGSVEPTACPANSSATPGRAVVEECLCHAGFHFAGGNDGISPGSYFCLPCAPGFYNELVNQSACVACPEDTFNPDTAAPSVTSCLACDPNAAAPSASFTIEACACNLGYAGAPGEACSACEPGTFRENSASYICEDCPANTYNVFFHSSSRAACLACHANTSSAAGSRSQRACVCDPGLSGVLQHGGTDGVYECTPCAGGTFAEAANSSVCDACAAGKFSASVGAKYRETCQACASGSVALQPGMTACVPCGASTWQNTSAPGHQALPCEACPANASHAQESVVDVFTCVCAAGLYKSPLDFGFRCALCEPGSRCPGADRIEDCPFNTFSVGGVVTDCTPCAEHSRAATSAPLASPEQCQCVPGAEGTFHEHCSLCAPGKFQPLDLTFNGTGATGGWFVHSLVDRVRAQTMECQPCAADQFQPAVGATECVACHLHSSTAGAVGSDAATDCTCDAGFVGEDGVECSLCEPGRFCPGGEVTTVCRLFSHSPAGSSEQANCSCNAGYYSVNRTAACDKCPPGAWCAGGLGYVPCANASTSSAGAREVEQCFCLPGFWRGCTRTKDNLGRDAGFVDATGQPCVIRFEDPCVQCGPNDVCVNDTLLHCPEHSASLPGSDDRFDCICNSGYSAEYYR